MWKWLFVVFFITLGLVGCSNALHAVENSEPLLDEKNAEISHLRDKSPKRKAMIDVKKEQMKQKTKELDESKEAEKDYQTKSEAEAQKENVQSKQTSKENQRVEKLTEELSKDTKQTKSASKTSPVREKAKAQQKVNHQSNITMTDMLLPNSHSEPREELVTHVVIHFSSYAAVKPEQPYEVNDIYRTFEEYGVSAHYLIDREGKIFKMVPEDRVAYHAGKGHLEQFPEYKDRLNHHSIGIEIMAIGTKEEMLPMMSADTYRKIKDEHIGYTDAQYESVRKLIDDIATRYPHVKKDRNHIIGHDEYAKGRKTDPGSLFDWRKIGF